MRERIAGPRGNGKPLQIAVDSLAGTTGTTMARSIIDTRSDLERNLAYKSAFAPIKANFPL
jgi:hypothetical protein